MAWETGNSKGNYWEKMARFLYLVTLAGEEHVHHRRELVSFAKSPYAEAGAGSSSYLIFRSHMEIPGVDTG